MTIVVQEIIVFLILVASVAWIIRHIVRRRKSISSCNCDGCPFAHCTTRKNINGKCKKIDKKVAQSDK
ncbi:MAG: FeoB-associated Cys-rich membrane protein [Bacteroidaceae bacterium]|nr:FeoB-associated Cys-rich membrane protein [Bacteroidaceae bacterium]